MIDHITLHVSDLEKAKAFYLAALGPLGYETVMEFGDHAGLGAGGKPDLWLAGGGAGRPMHIAFTAKSHAEVKAFYDAALSAGGADNGAPGIRPHYHQDYFGAFVLDADSNNVEVVCHKPE